MRSKPAVSQGAQTDSPTKSSRIARKELGAFYTPNVLAEFLADWAINRPDVAILEPSIGEGALVRAALRRIDPQLGGRIVGCEIDSTTFKVATRQFENKPVEIVNMDFLNATPGVLGKVDVVLANPPFTRNHALSALQRRILRERFPTASFGAVGLWAYFLLHCLSFIRPGGRLALIAPGAAAFAGYAQSVLATIQAQFQSVSLVTLHERIAWDGAAQERAVLVLADGFQQGPARDISIQHGSLASGTLQQFQDQGAIPAPKNPAIALGELMDFQIGVVTGSNRHFLLTEALAERHELAPEDLSPIISRSRHVRSLAISAEDARELARSGEATLLLKPESLGERGSATRRYLARISRTDRRHTAWFSKRKPWWSVQLGRPPDGVFTYMNNTGPMLSLVEPGLTSTNTLHQVRFRSSDPQVRRAIAASVLTTFTQFGAEQIGRIYGGGVLKFELGDAKRIEILLPSLPISDTTWSELDKAVRRGDRDLAQALADEAILPEFFGHEWKLVADDMRRRISVLRSRRGVRAKPA